MDVMQESVPHEPLTIDGETTHVKSWVAPSMALLALLVGLTVGVVLGRSSVDHVRAESAPTKEVSDVLRGRIEAVNGGDANEIATFYAPNAVLEERDVDPAMVTATNTAIAEHLAGYVEMGFQLHPRGDILVYGKYATETLGWTNGGGVCIYELDDQLLIVHQWVIGGDPT